MFFQNLAKLFNFLDDLRQFFFFLFKRQTLAKFRQNYCLVDLVTYLQIEETLFFFTKDLAF